MYILNKFTLEISSDFLEIFFSNDCVNFNNSSCSLFLADITLFSQYSCISVLFFFNLLNFSYCFINFLVYFESNSYN